jgi:hypothetical protein
LAAKLASALGLARRLSRDGRRVVAVYWCGADDSDFAEATRSWLWSPQGPFRVQVADADWQDGVRVGALAAERLSEIEASGLAHGRLSSSWNWREDVQKLLPARDFGERAAAWAELCFGAEGLVVVDARSPRLRALGADLFERYRQQHRAATERLRAQAAALQEQGVPLQLHDDALASGLFRLEAERRVKLQPEQLGTADAATLVPSVLLRPLWQDALLSPCAALLGPAELAYHAQLAPLYEQFGVRAAVALPRAQLWSLPASVFAADPELARHGRLWRDPKAWLAAHALPAASAQALARYEAAGARALAELRTALPQLDAATLQATAERQRAQLDRLREALWPIGLAERGADWQHLVAWGGVGGQAQERVFALAALWQRFGRDASSQMLHELGDAFVASLEAGRVPYFIAALAGSD